MAETINKVRSQSVVVRVSPFDNQLCLHTHAHPKHKET